MNRTKPILLVFGYIGSYYLTFVNLALRSRWKTPDDSSESEQKHALFNRTPSLPIKFFGAIAVWATLLLPSQFDSVGALTQCGLRVICFFYACKIADLAFCKSHIPPKRLAPRRDNDISCTTMSVGRSNIRENAAFMWLLFSEMRYHSFDIAVKQKGRPPLAEQKVDFATPLGVALMAGLLNLYLPLAELRCICLLFVLQASLEALHALLHFGCHYPLFYKPLYAKSMADFWSIHWHACASPWLQSLAYKQMRKLGGRAAGVLTTFHVSGIWHGWASAALIDNDFYAWVLGCEVWSLFMLFGVICLAERRVWGERQGGLVQRVVIWFLPVLWAGQCFRTLERHTSIAWLRQH